MGTGGILIVFAGLVHFTNDSRRQMRHVKHRAAGAESNFAAIVRERTWFKDGISSEGKMHIKLLSDDVVPVFHLVGELICLADAVGKDLPETLAEIISLQSFPATDKSPRRRGNSADARQGSRGQVRSARNVPASPTLWPAPPTRSGNCAS